MKFPHFLLILLLVALAVAPLYWKAHEQDEAAASQRLAQVEQDLAQAQQDLGQMKQQLLLLLKRGQPDD